MSRPIRRIVPIAVAVLKSAALAVPAVSSAASTKTCKLSVGKARSLGATYVTSATGKAGFKVRGTSCAGQKVIRSFHACRKDKGRTGRCTKTVRGYSCSDRRPSGLKGPLSFEGDVTCRSGARRIVHHYQQNT